MEFHASYNAEVIGGKFDATYNASSEKYDLDAAYEVRPIVVQTQGRMVEVALSVAHDSHNIIVVGVNDEEMEFAVNSLIAQEGGIVLVKEGKVIEQMPMPIAGLMSDQSGEWVDEKLTSIHEKAYTELGICGDVEPVMTLCFMSLAVIPEIKLTDMGLFDVTTFSFIPVEISR